MNDNALQENTEFARWVIEHDCIPSSVTRIDAPIRAEGGALVTDGEGTMLITESSIDCDKRNPGMSKAEIEAELKRLLGIEKVIWFPGRRNVDITDVHIDAKARFVRPGVIAYRNLTPLPLTCGRSCLQRSARFWGVRRTLRVGACRSTLLKSRTHEAW
jgi:agmatine deiminase